MRFPSFPPAEKNTDTRMNFRMPVQNPNLYFFREKISLNWSIPLLIS